MADDLCADLDQLLAKTRARPLGNRFGNRERALFAQVFTLMRLKTQEAKGSCPNCGSLRLYEDVRVLEDEVASFDLCEVCGWERRRDLTFWHNCAKVGIALSDQGHIIAMGRRPLRSPRGAVAYTPGAVVPQGVFTREDFRARIV